MFKISSSEFGTMGMRRQMGVHLQDLRHVSVMTKIYRLVQLISLCTFV